MSVCKFRIIPDGYRLLDDGEKVEAGDLGAGLLEDLSYGWGRMPDWWIGKYFCDGAPGNPDFIARKL